MSAEERLLPEITLTSPDGNVFTGKWRSATAPQTKNIATFKTVGGNFGRVQDLGTELRPHSYTVYFEGEDHDLLSQALIAALIQTGAWTIEHPVLGRLENQYPTSFSPTINPVESENITGVDTAWITDYPEDAAISQVQRAAELQAAVETLNAAAASSFAQDAADDTFNLLDKINIGATETQRAINAALGPLLDTVDGAQDTMNALSLGITQTLDSLVGQSLELAVEMQTFCQTPAALLADVEGKLAGYETSINSLISDVLSGTPAEQKNQATTNQLNAVATFSGLCLSVIGDESIETRPQAIELADGIYSIFVNLTNSLDTYAADFDGLLYHERYFSQTDTFDALAVLVSKVQLYLFELALSLKREKIVILEKPTPAVMACLDYYDSGDDPALDAFIRTNNLTLTEIMLIPAGRELVIYV